VVAFTGAGVSVESGIPTFRDPGGIWDRFDPSEFGTWDGLARLAMGRPDQLAEFLIELRRVFAAARPSLGHTALARLEAEGLVEAVITQNVDGLHREAGSRRVLEIHGSFTRTVCLACGVRRPIGREEFLADLDRSILGLRTAFIPSLASLLPRCEVCDGPTRPDFVAFGEAVQDFDEARALAAGARVLLVVGTSGEVYPAAELPALTSGSGGTVVEVGPGPTEVPADLRLVGDAGEVLSALVERISGI
jgi:NAD-dependent deacetylase